MTHEEKGVYLDLLIYLYEKPDRYLKDEAHMARILGIRPQKVRRIWPRISEKFRRISWAKTPRKLGENPEITQGFVHSLVRDLQRNGMKLRGLQGEYFPTDPDPDPDPDKTKKSTPTEYQKKLTAKRDTKVFKKPSVDDVAAYCRDRRNDVDPEQFVDHYESNGWKVGKTGMKDWQAAVRTWERSQQDKRLKRRGDERPRTKDDYAQRQRERMDGGTAGGVLEGDGGTLWPPVVRGTRGDP